MADAAPEPKPIDNLENLDLLQTDLIAYIAKETGINMFEHDSTEVPAFTAADIKWSPMSVLSHAFSKTLSTNILEGKSSHMYPAVVLFPFKSGPGGVQSCKAIAPHVHMSAENPFSVTDDAERAEMMSHFPTFSFNDGLSEASSPLVPASIILVSFDNPHNCWASGTIEKVLKGRPDALPEWAVAIEGIKDLWEDPVAWMTANLLGGNDCDTFVPKTRQYNGSTIENGKMHAQDLAYVNTATSNKGQMLAGDCVADYDAMTQLFFEEFGVKFPIGGVGAGYRPFEQQCEIYNDPNKVTPAGKKLGAKPGTSNHGWGIAVDWNTLDSKGADGYNSEYYKWMLSGQSYFVNPSWAIKGGSKEEPWHWEWVDKSAHGF